ncbi:hypothetical protein Clacol_003326 [Clathrus columnatus]|uniref:Uncharacterized protein n=1 Tax=Clathrus columnatus TaxID=1419009 RepID=A0AAV5A366_9AGAM|nr:hypothetical protein Clacol_003326 [Clathrus columnatus]
MFSSELSEIVTKMKTQASTTLGWDVVVNYGETELNKLLAIAYDEDSTGNKAIKEFECSLETTSDETGNDYTINYTFNFGPPLITFIDTYIKPVCSLTVPVLGGTAKILESTAPPQSIGEKVYTITLNNLALATAKGGVTDNEVSFESPTPFDEPFIFPPESDASGVVFIDFEASTTDLLVEITFTGPDKCKLNDPDPECAGRSPLVDNHIGDIKDLIRNQILTKYKHVIYELARANNTKPVQGIQLLPKSFMFATYTPNKGETILSLFIQTGDTNNGIQDEHLGSNWDVLWSTALGCSPIPSVNTASIILAKNTVFTSMIEPSLKKQGYSGFMNNTIGSIQLQIDTKKKVYEQAHVDSGTNFMKTYHTEINIVLPELKLVLEQNPSDKPACCRGSWNYKYKFDWRDYHVYQEGITSDRYGSVTVENTLNEDAYTVKLKDEYTLQVNFTIRKEKWDVTATPDDQDFWNLINGGSKEVPPWTKDLNVFLPEMSIDMGSLNFFLTTNLLLPSREVIDIDTSLGVQVPVKK